MRISDFELAAKAMALAMARAVLDDLRIEIPTF